MSSRYVQLPNGSYLEWPQGVSAATFKAKATKYMSQNQELPVSTRGSSSFPLTAGAPKPFAERLADYLGQAAESTAKAPGTLFNRSRDIYKEGEQQGGIGGGIKMAEAPFRAEGETLRGMLKSLLDVSTPGIINRMSKHEDPAKIASDATSWMAADLLGGPKEPVRGEVSVGDAARQITDAVNPLPKQMAAFQRTLGEHLDKIITYAKANGIDTSSIEGMAKAMKGSGDWIRAHYYNDMLGPVKDRPVSIAGSIKGYSGETAGTPGTATLGQLDARLSQINAELNPKYSKGGIAGQAAVKSATELNAEAAGIRKELYSGIAKETGLDPDVVAKTRGSFGALDSLAEQTNLSATKERFSANKAERAPLSVNPLARGKEFVADKALNKMRGDVVGNKLRNATTKVRVKPYELPKANPTTSTPVSRTPLRGKGQSIGTWTGSTPAEQGAVPAKLDARRMANEVARKQQAAAAARAGMDKTLKSAKHPFWQDPRGPFDKGEK